MLFVIVHPLYSSSTISQCSIRLLYSFDSSSQYFALCFFVISEITFCTSCICSTCRNFEMNSCLVSEFFGFCSLHLVSFQFSSSGLSFIWPINKLVVVAFKLPTLVK